MRRWCSCSGPAKQDAATRRFLVVYAMYEKSQGTALA
jgi:hypothetical protein